MSYVKRAYTIIFLLFLLALPWQTRLIWHDASLNSFTWEYGRFSLYGTEILLWALLILFAYWLLQTKKPLALSASEIWTRLHHPAVQLYWLVVVFIAWAGISIAWASEYHLAAYQWVVLVEAGALMAFVVNCEISLSTIAATWVISAMIQSVFAIGQFFAQYTVANKWLGLAAHLPTVGGSIILQTETERWLRAYGSLPHPNVLGGFLAVAIIFLFYLADTAATRQQRLFVLSGAVVIVPALFFTFCRSAWIAMLACILFMGIWLMRHYQSKRLLVFYKLFFLILIMSMVLGINLWQPLLTRIQGTEPLEVNSIQLRLTFTQQALLLMQHTFPLGVGLGNYTWGVFQRINATWPGYYYQPVHNIYLLAFTELGIVGGGLFLLIIALLIKQALAQLKTFESVTILLALITWLIIGLFDHYTWTLWCGIMAFWLTVGLNIRQLAKKIA